MRIFVLLPRIPYPIEKGDKLRAFHQLKHLSKDAEIILCALSDTKPHPDAYTELIKFVDNIHFIEFSKKKAYWRAFKALFSPKPLQVAYFYDKKIQQKVDKIISFYNPDHIYAQLIRVSEYVKDKEIPKTIDFQDAFSVNMERRAKKDFFLLKPILRKEAKRLAKYENQIFDFFNHKTIISYPDRKLINHPKKEEITVIPNGVDFDFFKPQLEVKKDFDIVFVGNMNYMPNVDGAIHIVKDILPKLKEKFPNIKILLSGANPHKKVLALQDKKHVFVSGWVDDIRESYARSKIFLAPMRIGTGLQNKLLEAMAMGIPCITSPLANDALHAKPNQEILIGENSDDYAAHVFSLLNNELIYKSISENGRNFVLNNYDWEKTTDLLSKIMKETKTLQ